MGGRNRFILYEREGKAEEHVDVSRTEAHFSDFTPASKLLDVSRLTMLFSILLKRSSGDLEGRNFVLSHTYS